MDVDDTVEEDQTKYVFDVDKQKAALNGISTDEIARTMALALGSQAAGVAQVPHERTPVRIALWFPRVERSSLVDLSRIYAKGAGGQSGAAVGSRRLAHDDRGQDDLPPPAPARGVRAGRDGGAPAGRDDPRPPGRPGAGRPAELSSTSRRRRVPLGARTMFRKGGGVPWAVTRGITIGWWDEGEMYITIHLFRDLGFAMLAALIAIYIILMNQTGSYALPLTIMLAIPLMVIGVLPGFWLLNHVGTAPGRRIQEPGVLRRPGVHRA